MRLQRLATVFERAPTGLAELTSGGRFCHVNEVFSELLGRPIDALLGLHLADVTLSDDAAALQAACERAIAERTPVALLTRYVRPDGSVVRMSSRLARVEGEPGEARVVLAVTDASTDARDLESAGANEASFQRLLDNMRDYAILMIDASGRVETWGAGAQQVFGYSHDEMIGQPLDVLFTPEDRAAEVVEREFVVARSFGHVSEDRWHLRKGGERFWTSGVMSPLYDEDGTLRGYAKVCRDLTTQKRADEAREAQLARETSARAVAEQATVARDAFLATVSHELRTPLSAMLLWARMLEEGQASERERAAGLAAIVRGGEAQRQLIEELLDLSRMVSGTLRIAPAEVRLASIARTATDTVQAMARASQVQLTTDLGAGEDVVVKGDPGRLQQVIWNLLTNAIKFTPPGGSVELRLEVATGVVRVVVHDTGRGIAPGFLPHVFERFRQGESDPARVTAGLGLGLSIARQLVELHGGRIEAASAGEGRGATFTVTLPRLGRPTSIAPPATPVASGSAPSARPLDGVRVLLVEDNAETRQALTWLLEASGAEVAAASSATAALASFAQRWPDVVVSDIGLPGDDGYELMLRVRALAEASGRPVPPALALTAYARIEDRERALAAGFAAYASKPIEPQPLIEAVRTLASQAEAPTFVRQLACQSRGGRTPEVLYAGRHFSAPETHDQAGIMTIESLKTSAAPARLRVFLADDHPLLRSGLRHLIAAQPDMDVVGEAADGRSTVQAVRELRPDVAVVDVSMPVLSGTRATEELCRGAGTGVKVLALSAHEDRSSAQQMLAAGASGYMVKRTADEELVRAIRMVAAGQVYIDASLARTLVQGNQDAGPPNPAESKLSERESAVLKQLARGHAVKRIAADLDVGARTVETYRARAMTKLGLKNRADIVRHAVQQGWLDES